MSAQNGNGNTNPPELNTDEVLDWMLGIVPHPEIPMDEKAISNIKFAAKLFCQSILRNCPNRLDRMGALRKVKEAMFLAESAVRTPHIML